MASPHRVVILGGGFAGIRVARRLAAHAKREHLSITLINRDGTHAFTPGFYLLAGAVTDAARRRAMDRGFALPIRRLIAGLPISFIQGEVSGIDTDAHAVSLADGRSLAYDTLVVSLGSEPNYYGIPGLKEHAITLKSLADADRINRTVAKLMRGRNRPLRVTIGGAGATGVELSAMLAERIGAWQAGVHISLIEACPEILNGFPQDVRSYAAAELERRDVRIHTGVAITGTTEFAVTLADGTTLDHDLLIWTGGIQAPALLASLPYVCERGRLVADADLSCVPQEPGATRHVYALGDASCFHYKDAFLPWTANMALQQADHAARNIVLRIEGRKERPFTPKRPVFVVPLGTTGGVAEYLGIRFRGRIAQMLSFLAEARYVHSMLPLLETWKLLRRRSAAL